MCSQRSALGELNGRLDEGSNTRTTPGCRSRDQVSTPPTQPGASDLARCSRHHRPHPGRRRAPRRRGRPDQAVRRTLGSVAGGKQNEHVLESRILRGDVAVTVDAGILERIRPDPVVNWGSQFPTVWGPGPSPLSRRTSSRPDRPQRPVGNRDEGQPESGPVLQKRRRPGSALPPLHTPGDPTALLVPPVRPRPDLVPGRRGCTHHPDDQMARPARSPLQALRCRIGDRRRRSRN